MNENGLSVLSSILNSKNMASLFIQLVQLQHKNDCLQRQINYLLCNIIITWQPASWINWALCRLEIRLVYESHDVYDLPLAYFHKGMCQGMHLRLHTLKQTDLISTSIDIEVYAIICSNLYFFQVILSIRFWY